MKKNEQNDSNLNLDQYVKAVGLLTDENIAARLGGIYLFEELMNSDNKEDQKYHNVIIEFLCAYVREKTHFNYYEYNEDKKKLKENPEENMNILDKYNLKVETDIQTIIKVLERRKKNVEEVKIDLNHANLYQIQLSVAHLENVDLTFANLNNANLEYANLENADLSHAHLENANLSHAHIENADLTFANLENADLSVAHIENARLWNAHLENANLISAHLEEAFLLSAHLENANLSHAHLENANLSHAHLEFALLEHVHLEDATLRKAKLYDIKFFPLYLSATSEEEKEKMIDFIKELEKAKDVKGIKLDDRIMKIIEEEFPDLFKRIKEGEE